MLDSTLQLADVLLDLLQLLLLSHELLRDEVQVVPALVLLHDLEHVLQVLSELLVILDDPHLLLVLPDLDLDALLGQRDGGGHDLVGVLAEPDAAGPQLVAEVVEGDQLGVLELLAQEGTLVDRELLPQVHLVGVGFVDVVVGFGELGSVAQVTLSVLHDLHLQILVPVLSS